MTKDEPKGDGKIGVVPVRASLPRIQHIHLFVLRLNVSFSARLLKMIYFLFTAALTVVAIGIYRIDTSERDDR